MVVIIVVVIILMVAVAFVLTSLVLRVAIGNAPSYWSADAGRKEVGRILLMIGLTLFIIIASGLVLNGLDRDSVVSYGAAALLTKTLVLAAFLQFGWIRWPERRRVASWRQLVLTGAVAVAFTAWWKSGVLEAAAEGSITFSAGALLMLAGSLIIDVVTEEVMFRVLLLTALVDLTRSRIDALVLSAFVFGLVHAPGELMEPLLYGGQGGVPPLGAAAFEYAPIFLAQTVLGLFFGALWLRTGSIALVVGTHVLFNLGATLAEGL